MSDAAPRAVPAVPVAAAVAALAALRPHGVRHRRRTGRAPAAGAPPW
ncbi:MAG TPA: hypothetical protein VFI47_28045 [Acidimicrobiales bacterium]|nr:hypothetical protein [Acidimicrobiales bacterium]